MSWKWSEPGLESDAEGMAFWLKNYPCIGLFSWILDQENHTGSMVEENHNGSMAEAAIQHYSRNENNKQVLTVKSIILLKEC